MSAKLLYYSSFMSRPTHGGGHRWAQLEELIKASTDDCAPMRFPDNFSAADKLRGTLSLCQKGYLHNPSRAWLYYGGLYSATLRSLRAQRPNAVVVETLDPRACVLIAACNEIKIPWIAVPPNLDSLLSPVGFHDDFHPPIDRKKDRNFTSELAWLKTARTVFAIAQEEAFFLNNLGFSAHWLDYFPDSNLAGEFAKARTRRTPKNFYLLLGSAINPPTRLGLLEQLAFLVEKLEDGEKVVVTGLGTETLPFSHPNITVEGTVSYERLGELFERCKLAWIHQSRGVGALTRLSELLLAGVPIIANYHAARSATHYKGIATYESFADALALARQEQSTPPIPERPLARERFFVESLKELCL